ncbi:MAG TPA: sulfotransferase [Acetobacteraceae bacterium]|jgi:tetratricopeptide (TPR) repeat protein
MPSEPNPTALLDTAVACHQAGQHAEAEALYRQVLQADPDDLDALNLLGVLLQDRGDLAGSIALLSHAIELDPEFPEALTNLARAQCAAGDAEAAAANAALAVIFDAELAEAHQQHGRALLMLGQNQAAVDACREAVRLTPQSADAHCDLGAALARLGADQEAAAAFRGAIELQPDHLHALLGLANASTRLREHEAALALSEKAVAAAPDHAESWVCLAYARRDNRDVPGSIEACQRAIAIAPERPGLWILQGDNLAAAGQFDQAREHYEHAGELDPGSVDALAGLAKISQLSTASSSLGRLQDVLDDAHQPAEARITAGFTLGTVHDAAAHYDSAFASYAAANSLALEALNAHGRSFEREPLAQRIDWLMEAFGPDTFRAIADWGDPSELPVFIVGSPRSGTTLAEQIVASHPLVFGAGERKDIPDIAFRLESDAAVMEPQTWDKNAVQREAREHLARLHSLGNGAERVIDKLPDNILLLGHIAMLFPRARVVICRRELRDVGLSCFFQPFRDNMPWSFDLADIATRLCETERLSCHWRDALPLRVLELQYEALVGDLEGESRRLIDFLGLDWDASCLAFHQLDRPVMTASGWQVRQPLYTSSVGRWRHYQSHIGALQEGLAGVATTGAEADTPEQILASVHRHLDAGRSAAAEAALRSLLALHPDTPDALQMLGQLLSRRGAFAQAAPLLESAVSLRPDDAPTLVELAGVQHGRGDLQSAASTAGRAVDLAPNDAAARLRLGLIRLDREDATGAEEALKEAVRLDPASFEAQLQLAIAQIRRANARAAAGSLRAAVALNPDHAEARAKLGFVLNSLERHDEALEHHQRAVELAPDDPRAHHGLVTGLWRMRDAAATAEAAERLLELAPGMADIWLARGYALSALGRFDEAQVCFRHALVLYPDYQDARLGLAEITHEKEDPAELERLEAALGNAGIGVQERAAAGFALGTAFERTYDYDAAFAAYAEANRLIRESRPRPLPPVDAKDLRRIFPRKVFGATAGWGDPSELPVFIVGMPRSGTTLVEQIAASHPAVFGAGEGKEIASIVSALDHGLPYSRPASWNRLTVRKEATWHIARLREVGGDAARVTNKMPDNLRYLGHLSVLFPNARIVICRRDLRDVCLSCFFRRFTDEALDWANDLRDLALRAKASEDLVALWREVLPTRVLEISYERLVGNLETESRRLIEFLGLEWDPACLSFYETERAVLTASQWQVRQPIYDSSVGRWRHYRKHLGPLLRELAGYVPDDDAGSAFHDAGPAEHAGP